ncbi:MAG: phage tail protein [Methylocella sp.]
MGFLRGPSNPGYVYRYNGVQIQTASNAVPITILYGQNRLAANAIWTGGFYSRPVKQNQGKGGGNPVQSYNYYTSFLMGLCEGPMGGYVRTFVNQQQTLLLNGTGLEVATGGSTPQAPWGYLSAHFPGQDLGYNGLAYVGAFNYFLGSSPNLPQFSFVLNGIAAIRYGNVINGFDSDPALIIQDFLTNAQYGVLFPSASIDATTLLGVSGDSSYQTYCRATYLALSPCLTNQESANSIISRWLKLTKAAAVWSGGKLKFISYGDSVATNPNTSIGSVTFNPNVTRLYNLADDDFIHEDGKDPLEVIRSDPYASYNWQRLQINDITDYYDATPIDAYDQNAIELYGLRMASDITASEITDPSVGIISANLILQRGLYIRNTYKFKLSMEYCLLEPMDIVAVTDSGIGLSNVAIRITEIEEDDNSLLAVTAEEFPSGVASAVKYPTQPNKPNSTDQNIIPSRVNPPVIFEPPAVLTGGVPNVSAAVSAGLQTVYLLAEDNSNGQHSATQTVAASQANLTQIVFSVNAQAVTRSALRLNINNGSFVIGCDFNVSTGVAGTPDAGITAASITLAPGSTAWYLCSISCPMAAAAVPVLSILLENPHPTTSYAGTSGDGIYIWGAQYSAGAEPMTFLPAFASFTGGSTTPNGAATPEGASGIADPNWGGAFVWISTDGNTYSHVGTVSGPARQGVLYAALAAPAGANPDTASTLSVDLTESGGILTSGTAADAQNGVTLCLVDNELLAFAAMPFVSGNKYSGGPSSSPTGLLYRGLYGTTPVAHSIGASFARVDGAIFNFPLPQNFIGVTVYMKFQSFNIFGNAIEDLSECAAYTYSPTGSGSPLGPVSQALAAGSTRFDFRFVSEAISETDQWGVVTDGVLLASINLGLVSDPVG